MQCWDITLEAVSFRNNAANRRVKEHDTAAVCMRYTLSPARFSSLCYGPCDGCMAFLNISKIKTLQFLFLSCKFLFLEICEAFFYAQLYMTAKYYWENEVV